MFDVRDKAIALETNRQPKVYLGKIWPLVGTRMYVWESAWGGNRGQAPTIERCQYWIEVCAKGMYK